MSDLSKVEVVPVSLEAHPNADTLSLVRVYNNYVVCVRTQDWLDRDRGAYIAPDNVVPDREEFAFLDGKRRIKAKKLRGIMSQGLLVPVPDSFQIGDDVTDYFDVRRYVPEVDARLNAGNRGTPPPFPGHKYDLESWFKYSHVFNDGEEVVFSEKLHGCLDGSMSLTTLELGELTIKDICERRFVGHVKCFDHDRNEVAYSHVMSHSILDNNTGEDWYEIVLENGRTIKLTGEHKIYCVGLDCYRRVDELDGTEDLLID